MSRTPTIGLKRSYDRGLLSRAPRALRCEFLVILHEAGLSSLPLS